DLIDRELLLHDAFTRAAKMAPRAVENMRQDARKEWDKYVKGIEEAVVKAGAVIKSKKDLKDFIREQGMDLDFQHDKFEKDHIARIYLQARVVSPIIDGTAIGRQQIYE